MRKNKSKIIGPFSQILSMTDLPDKGSIKDSSLEIIQEAGVKVVDGKIQEIKSWKDLYKEKDVERVKIKEPSVLLPGFIDAHTHICYAGSRARDYALRNAGLSYLEIAKQGGGILDTVRKTRKATASELSRNLKHHSDLQLKNGVTTCEVKSGYGLNVNDELKMLEVIRDIHQTHALDLIPTCLAAHTLPPEFKDHQAYLDFLIKDLLPLVKKSKLADRVDIFVEEGAFAPEISKKYLLAAKEMGFNLVVHADQFSTGGSLVACEAHALSAEHLEVSSDAEIENMLKNNITAVVLPGCSLGLGIEFAPARKLLDKGLPLVIASDWNPGSAPMGDLLTQASLLGASENLSAAEIFSGITCRAAKVLKLEDRGMLTENMLADMVSFPCEDYQEILYHQGQMRPNGVWKRGRASSV